MKLPFLLSLAALSAAPTADAFVVVRKAASSATRLRSSEERDSSDAYARAIEQYSNTINPPPTESMEDRSLSFNDPALPSMQAPNQESKLAKASQDPNTSTSQKSMQERLEALSQPVPSIPPPLPPVNTPPLEFIPKKPSRSSSGLADELVANLKPVWIQGNTLKTWSYKSPTVNRIVVYLETDGRPLDADIDLWQGPDNTPQRMRVHLENGRKRPLTCFVETPRDPNTIAIRNIGQLEFPIAAYVGTNPPEEPPANVPPYLTSAFSGPTIIQGGALKTFAFEPAIDSVRVILQTDGRPLTACIEMLQGPNNVKEIVDLYIEDGSIRPFSIILETPGSGNVVRVKNLAKVEFPMLATLEPFSIDEDYQEDDIVLGGSDEQFGTWDPQWS